MITSWLRRLPDHPRMADTLWLVVVCALAVPGSLSGAEGSEPRTSWWPGFLLAVGAGVLLFWRRTYRRTVAAVTIADAAAIAAIGYVPSPLLLGPAMVALFSLAVRTDRRTANTFAFTGIGIVVAAALAFGLGPHTVALAAILPAVSLLLPTALGTTTRVRQAYLEAAEARAEFAERTREEEARHRVAAERMRIARELHDVIAHHLALANAQAGAVGHLMRSQPEQAEKLVTELTSTTSSALRELKATVGLLRQPDDPAAPLEPSPGLAQLPALAASLESTGLTVTVVTEGEPLALSPGVDLTAFRIVQEALTNVTKHAITGAARVVLAYGGGRLTITVSNDGGTKSASSGPGYGIVGMRERAASVGGRLHAGTLSTGGFEVAAELPLQPFAMDET